MFLTYLILTILLAFVINFYTISFLKRKIILFKVWITLKYGQLRPNTTKEGKMVFRNLSKIAWKAFIKD